MIAAAGYANLLRGETADLRMTADITLRLQNTGNAVGLTGKKVPYRV